jgi:hypothetical protein
MVFRAPVVALARSTLEAHAAVCRSHRTCVLCPVPIFVADRSALPARGPVNGVALTAFWVHRACFLQDATEPASARKLIICRAQ